MSFSVAPARKGKNSVLLGLAGPAKSGKTLSALRVAKGLGGKIILIDTENKRSLHYADKFDFFHIDFQPPYTPARYIEAIDVAIKNSANVVIVDSASHEWEGEGGILEMQLKEHEKLGGQDATKFTSWIKPKAENNKFVNHVLKMNVHFIFCFRAKEGMELKKNEKGKIAPVKLGWVPVCGDRLDYEMTALVVLPPNSKGTPDMTAPGMLMPYYMKSLLSKGQLTEETGKELATWAGATPPSGKADTRTDVDTPLDDPLGEIIPIEQPPAESAVGSPGAGEEGAAPAETAASPPASRALDDPPAATTKPLPPVPRGVDPDLWQQACSFAEDGRDALTGFCNTISDAEWKTIQPNLSPLKELFPK